MVAMTGTQFPSKATAGDEASRASVKRGRKPVVTPERVNMICELLARGESERSACIRVGIGSTAWGAASGIAQTYASVFQQLVTNGRK
jgi:hypothetical protein